MFKFKHKSNVKFKFYNKFVLLKNQSNNPVEITTDQFSVTLAPDKNYHKFSINAFKSDSNNIDLSYNNERHRFKVQTKKS